MVLKALIVLGISLICQGIGPLAGSSQSQPIMDPATIDQLKFLLGEWVAGEVTTWPGQGMGSFTLSPDLQGRIIVRRNHADYVATKDRPAFSHDDLMIIYPGQGTATRAIYFDNEGHVINYTVEISRDQTEVVLLGDVTPSAPRFKFTYKKIAPDTLGLKFEIAPPGQPETFSVYIKSSANRKK